MSAGAGDVTCRHCGTEIVKSTNDDGTWTWVHVHPEQVNEAFCGEREVAEP